MTNKVIVLKKKSCEKVIEYHRKFIKGSGKRELTEDNELFLTNPKLEFREFKSQFFVRLFFLGTFLIMKLRYFAQRFHTYHRFLIQLHLATSFRRALTLQSPASSCVFH